MGAHLTNATIGFVFRDASFQRAMQTSPPADQPPLIVFMVEHASAISQSVFLALLLVSVFMLIVSSGLPRRWNWARLCFIGFAVLAIVGNLVQLVFGIGIQFFVFSWMREQLAAASAQSGGPDKFPFVIMLDVMSVVFVLAVCVLFGWLAKKLMSAPIVAEFRRSPE